MPKKSSPTSFDAIVVGGGTSGACAAWNLAKAGLSTALVDSGVFETAGARWVNSVPPWMFERAGVPQPKPPELRQHQFPFRAFDYKGRCAFRIAAFPMGQVDMRLLVARLQRLAWDAGVVPVERTRVQEVVLEGERPVALVLEQKGARGAVKAVTLNARLFVDATGLSGAILRRVPALSAGCPQVKPEDLCIAAQEVRKITNPEQARCFLREHGAEPADSLGFLGVDGGFSTRNVHISAEVDEVEFLTGSIADGKHLTGRELIDAFIAKAPWVGDAVFGGAGLIPIRRPYDRFTSAGLALLGNAACQVFPAHGSGIGIGLIAGRLLAEAATGGPDPGAERTLWQYQARFMREFGAVFGAYDLFRRLTQTFRSEEVAQLLESGLLRPSQTIAALSERMPPFSPAELFGLTAAALKAPRIAARLFPAALLMNGVWALYKTYPMEPDLKALARWSRRVCALVGGEPDITTL